MVTHENSGCLDRLRTQKHKITAQGSNVRSKHIKCLFFLNQKQQQQQQQQQQTTTTTTNKQTKTKTKNAVY